MNTSSHRSGFAHCSRGFSSQEGALGNTVTLGEQLFLFIMLVIGESVGSTGINSCDQVCQVEPLEITLFYQVENQVN